MKSICLLFIAVVLFAGDVATAPSIGMVLSAEGRLTRVTGVAGAVVVESAGEEELQSAAFSGRLLLSIAGNQLRADDGNGPVAAEGEHWARALLGFSPAGDQAAGCSPETGVLHIWRQGRWHASRLQLPTAAVAIRLAAPDRLDVLLKEDGLRLRRIRISDGATENEQLIHAEAAGPAMVLSSGDILYALGDSVIRHGADGQEDAAHLPEISGFAVMGNGWVQANSASGQRYAIRVRPDLRMMELPEVSQ
jgi:hypothetical protein